MSKEKDFFIPALQDTPTEVMYLQKKIFELEGRLAKLELETLKQTKKLKELK
jgi:hypothetical protein